MFKDVSKIVKIPYFIFTELPWFQHFSSAKTSNKFLNAWGKIISTETLLDETMFVA